MLFAKWVDTKLTKKLTNPLYKKTNNIKTKGCLKKMKQPFVFNVITKGNKRYKVLIS